MYGSNDNSTWKMLSKIDNVVFTNYLKKTYPIDNTTLHRYIKFVFTKQAVRSKIEVAELELFSDSRSPQTITLGALPDKVLGDADFNPNATATSGLTVTYSSSNASVATIVNNQIHIVGNGTSTITVSQGGNELYYPASEVSQIFTVKTTSTELNNIISNSINIYPNLVQSKAIVQLEKPVMNDAIINIYNSIGILVMTQKIYNQSSILDMSKLTCGIYYVKIMNGGETVSKKLIKI
jgi:hypothetical protein